MAADERPRIEVERDRSATRAPVADDFVLQLEAQVARAPDALAVCDATGQLSYAELNHRANRYARYFQTAGIGKHALVGTWLPRSAELVAVLIGIWKAGAAFLPLDPNYPAERTRFMLEDAAATHLIVQGEPPQPITRTPLSIVNLDACERDVARQSPENPGIAASVAAMAYVIYTSGSTGRPKGVTIDRANVGHYAQALTAAIGVGPDDHYLHTASFAFSASIRQFVVPLAVGASVHIASVEELRDPRLLFATIRSQQISVLDLVPSFSAACLRVVRSIDAAARTELLDNDVRLMLSASEPLPSVLVEGWRALWRSDLAFINMYGQTETTGIVLTHAVPADGEASTVVPIGGPIANTRAYILDASLSVVAAGVRGELYIAGSSVGSGYRNRPELTAQAFLADPFAADAGQPMYRTGDLAQYRADGTIEICGRADAQLKIRGFRIEPGEIEATIRDRLDVEECFVCMLPSSDAHVQNQLAAFVATGDASQDADAFVARMRQALRQTLPEYMIPQQIALVNSLPRTMSGKIDRQALLAGLSPP